MLDSCKFNNIDGVSCYIISILYILQHISIFNNFMINNNFSDNLLINHLSKLFKYCNNNKNMNISPISFKKKISEINQMWGETEHQDSQEFITFLLTIIDEELEKIIPNNYIPLIKKKKIGDKYYQENYLKKLTPIKDIFYGILISSIKCNLCNHISNTFELFITIPLTIKIATDTQINQVFTLNECIENFISDEQLDMNNMITCNDCQLYNQSIKKILFWKAPKVLIFQLKRFILNAFGIPIAKIINRVEYPTQLDITQYFHPESPFKNDSIYELVGINLHCEASLGNINMGHYVSIIKNEKWYLFNDDQNIIELNEEKIQQKDAYLLFYVKT